MWSRRHLALLATLAVVAVPAPALAQDEGLLAQAPELEDSLPTPEPEPTPESQDDAPDGEDPAEGDLTGAEGEEADDGDLPATGGEAGLIAALGAGMLLTGSGLRVRLRGRA